MEELGTGRETIILNHVVHKTKDPPQLHNKLENSPSLVPIINTLIIQL